MGNCLSSQPPKKGAAYEERIVREGEQFVRIEGKDLTKNPYRSIRAITCFLDSGAPSFGTGVMLSKNLFLTAAHVVFEKRQNAVSTNFKLYTQSNGIGKDYYYIKGWKYLPQFETCPNSSKLKLDYALVKIQQDPNLPILYNDFPAIMVTCKNCLKKDDPLKIGIFGYPLNHRGNFELINEGGIRLYQYGFQLRNRVEQIDHQNSLISYKINTEGGQSGSPIIMEGNIIGIHNGFKGDANIGRLVTSEMTQNILKWSKQLQGDPITIKYNGQCCRRPEKPKEQLKKQIPKAQAKKQEPKELIKNQKLKMKEQKQSKDNKKQSKPIIKTISKPLEIQKEQKKTIQIKQKFLNQIADRLENIPAQEKKKITSLTLKATVSYLIKRDQGKIKIINAQKMILIGGKYEK